MYINSWVVVNRSVRKLGRVKFFGGFRKRRFEKELCTWVYQNGPTVHGYFHPICIMTKGPLLGRRLSINSYLLASSLPIHAYSLGS